MCLAQWQAIKYGYETDKIVNQKELDYEILMYSK